MGQLLVAREDSRQTFRLQLFEHLMQSNRQRNSGRISGLIFGLGFPFLLQVKIEPGVLRLLAHSPGLFTHADKRKAGRQHQGLLRPCHNDIQSPFIRLEIKHPHRADGIHHQDRLFQRLHDPTQRFHIMRHTGGGFTRLDVDRLDGRIFFQGLRHVLRIDRVSPLHLDLFDFGPVNLAELQPAFSELAAVDHQRLITRRKEIGYGAFHPAGTGRDQRDHVLPGLEQPFQILPHLPKNFGELGRTMMQNRMGHGQKDFGRNRGRPGSQKITLPHNERSP